MLAVQAVPAGLSKRRSTLRARTRDDQIHQLALGTVAVFSASTPRAPLAGCISGARGRVATAASYGRLVDDTESMTSREARISAAAVAVDPCGIAGTRDQVPVWAATCALGSFGSPHSDNSLTNSVRSALEESFKAEWFSCGAG